MHFFLSILFLVVGAVEAQHSEQPLKADTSDSRSGTVLFEIEDKENNDVIQLHRTVSHDHVLRKKEDLVKLANKEAKKLEMDFASMYLKCQYEIEEVPGECKSGYKLTLNGDIQDICLKDEKKSQEIRPLYDSLKKRFE